MTFYEQMVPLLSNLLEIGETLKAPIYGTLLQKKRNYTFGYLGLSENAILVSLLQGDSKKLKGANRIPFSSIQKTKVRKSVSASIYSPNLFNRWRYDKVPNI